MPVNTGRSRFRGPIRERAIRALRCGWRVISRLIVRSDLNVIEVEFRIGGVSKQTRTADRIWSGIDSFDAMTNHRPYRRGRPVDEAVLEIVSCTGTQFSPRVVDALVRLFERGELAFVRPDEDLEQAA